MNECEQIHPLLRGYLADSLSARDRRLVARHLNLCAMARKEMDRLRSGPVKAPAQSASPASEPWDLKILRWLFKTPKPSPAKETEPSVKKSKARKVPTTPENPQAKTSSRLKPMLWIVVFFCALVFLTHFIQNAGENPVVKGTERWMAKNGIHLFGVKPELEMVLDLTNQPQWFGNAAPAAFAYQELVTDQDRFRVYWRLLQPGVPPPEVDFNKNALAVVLLGPQTATGYEVKFKRSESFSDKTILWYDVVSPPPGSSAAESRPWVMQLVPKPEQSPALIQKVQ